MSKRKIFLEAAELIEKKRESKGACNALWDVAGIWHDKYGFFFTKFFRPDDLKSLWWMDEHNGGGGKEQRVLALCLAQVLWDEEHP
jgi:hypothetical protein